MNRATAKVPEVARPPMKDLHVDTRAVSTSGFRAAAAAEAEVCTRHPLPSMALRCGWGRSGEEEGGVWGPRGCDVRGTTLRSMPG
jgi:hypothetical protein